MSNVLSRTSPMNIVCPTHKSPCVGSAIPHWTCGCRIGFELYTTLIRYAASKYQREHPNERWPA